MKFNRLLLLVFSLFIFSSGINAQNKKPYTLHANGVKYKMHKDVKGPLIKEGNILELNIVNRNAKDSMIFNTYEAGAPFAVEVSKTAYRGDLMSALMLLSKGDSATFWFDIDSIPDFEPIPGLLEKGSLMKYTVKVEGVYTNDEYMKRQENLMAEQLKKDTAAIVKYLKTNNIKNYKRTASGLFYVIESQGETQSANPVTGQKVTVHYTGTLLNGNKFDSSRDRNAPFEFTLGRGEVIQGWDEGIALLNKGTKAKLFIPSGLGYGAQGAGGVIPGNAVLVFDVELINF